MVLLCPELRSGPGSDINRFGGTPSDNKIDNMPDLLVGNEDFRQTHVQESSSDSMEIPPAKREENNKQHNPSIYDTHHSKKVDGQMK